jgi:hypothetical protein
MDDHPDHLDDDQYEVAGLRAIAERIDALADVAELMGDDRQAAALRERSQVARLRAMRLLDG